MVEGLGNATGVSVGIGVSVAAGVSVGNGVGRVTRCVGADLAQPAKATTMIMIVAPRRT
jgi:hypothetical protein